MPKSDTVVLGVAAGAIVTGMVLWKRAQEKNRPPRLGDKIILDVVKFAYAGRDALLYICWGLRKGRGDFNNGENLVGGPGAFGYGAIPVQLSLDYKLYSMKGSSLQPRPILFLNPLIYSPGTYDTYIWLSVEASANEKAFVRRDGGGLIDTDAGAIIIVEK